MEEDSRFRILYVKMNQILDQDASGETSADIEGLAYYQPDFISEREMEGIGTLREIVEEISTPRVLLLSIT